MTAAVRNKSGLIGLFAHNSVAANLLMIGLLVGGLMMMNRMNAEVFPEIDPRAITVTVIYPGATPGEVEDSVTRRAEEAVLGIEGVERVSSSATEGSGVITIEINDFVDAQAVKEDVQSAIDQLVGFPPSEAEQPEVQIVSAVSSVMRLVLTGDVGERALRTAGERLERDLVSVDGVSLVTLQGARNYEISIEIPEATLRQYNISIAQVAGTIRTASVNLSAGTIRTDGGDILLRTDEEARDADAFGNIVVIRDFQGRRVLLRDIANIVDGFEEAPLSNTYNGKPAVFLQIDRSGEEDAFDVANAVKSYLETYRPPAGIDVLIASDDTERINDRINLLGRNAIMGLALVFVFLALTLDLRLAFWTSMGIPVAFLGGFIFFGQFTTVNMLTLFGLIMVLGIVVDDAVVVGENIYEQQANGTGGIETAISGAKGVFAPVLVGILTSMAVFAPLLQMTGILGQLLSPVPVVVIGVLFVSLVEVFLILPSHLAHGGEWSVGPMHRLKLKVQDALFTLRDRALMPAVEAGMRMPYLVIAICLAILIAFAGLFTGGHVRFIFFPQVEGEEIRVSLEMPSGSPYALTQAAMDRVVKAGYGALGGEGSDLYRSLSVTVGGALSSGFRAQGTRIQSELASATLELAPASERQVSAADIERQWRENIGQLPGIKSLSFESAGLSGGADVSFNLSHTDNEKLFAAVDDLTAKLQLIEGVSEIETSAEAGKRELSFSLTQTGVAAGLTVDDLARQIRQSYFGEEVQRLQRGGEEVRVYVRFPQAERRSLADLARLRIPLPNGEDVQLVSVANVEETRSYASIDRVDGRRIISITADVDEAVTTPNEVNALIETNILPALLDQDADLRVTQEGQARDQAEDLASLGSNLSIALLIMYVLLASVLRSYHQPIIILAIVPFGLVGSVMGHLLLGYDVSFLSLFGVVALCGVIVNDSIVLIDYYNELNASGEGGPFPNIAQAVRRRFRPILLTTVTTFIGLVPMIAETSVQAQFLIPMALSIAFGILFASGVILFLVPACLAIGVQVQNRASDRLISKEA